MAATVDYRVDFINAAGCYGRKPNGRTPVEDLMVDNPDLTQYQWRSLTELGSVGWELATVIWLTPQLGRAIFKRVRQRGT